MCLPLPALQVLRRSHDNNCLLAQRFDRSCNERDFLIRKGQVLASSSIEVMRIKAVVGV